MKKKLTDEEKIRLQFHFQTDDENLIKWLASGIERQRNNRTSHYLNRLY
jgi:hypothetical protein